MSDANDFLVEIGTEELPPKALHGLMTAFAENMVHSLRECRLTFSSVRGFASPRRLAVIVTELAAAQEDRAVQSKGPPVSIAFDGEGKPTAAGLAFAKKCGVAIGDIGRSSTKKGEWLSHRAIEAGVASSELLPGCVNSALEALPIARRMRWGNSDVAFVRPVHWVVMLHGKTVVQGDVLGVAAGNETTGHRFLAPGRLTIAEPGAYLALLERKGFVIVDFDQRLKKVRESVLEAATACGGTAVGSDALYEEVAALNEWPVALTGRFDESFLGLPREVIVATLTSHQRYFSVAGATGELLPVFITIANLVSTDPDQVRAGNERVIRPRLADAAFFWDADRRSPAEEWLDSLKTVVYQKGLGSLADKSLRVAALAADAANELGANVTTVERAASLAKCDLVSAMVGEFPELQGVMGKYYALASGEPEAVAEAIGDQYLPKFSGDTLPDSIEGCCVAIADKLDTVCGIFSLGKKPSGNRDPFGLRRNALGVVRIIVERHLDLDLEALIATSVSAQGPNAEGEAGGAVYDFIVERMRSYSVGRGGVTPEVFESVRVRKPKSLLDFDDRLRAVASFGSLDEAMSLAAANKRIANILRKSAHTGGVEIDRLLLVEGAEIALFDALGVARIDVAPLFEARNYAAALARLAGLREQVDCFFEEVMVMAEDDAIQSNRLTLLSELRGQFLRVADISRLSISKG